jgi:hypothetical protein
VSIRKYGRSSVLAGSGNGVEYLICNRDGLILGYGRGSAYVKIVPPLLAPPEATQLSFWAVFRSTAPTGRHDSTAESERRERG